MFNNAFPLLLDHLMPITIINVSAPKKKKAPLLKGRPKLSIKSLSTQSARETVVGIIIL